MGRPKADAQVRYDGGVVRQDAQARLALQSKPQIALKDLAGSIGRGRWSRAVPRVVADLQAGRVRDTEQAYRVAKGGKYTAERQLMHQRIVDNLLQGKRPHEGSARAIFTAGGPASGKSKMIEAGHVNLPADPVHLNPDVVREMLPEYRALIAAGHPRAAQLTHEEASHITKLATKIALGRQHHILVDTVGDSEAGKFAKKIRDAQRAGYTASVHYATLPTSEALKRAKKRGARTGRRVPEQYLRDAHAGASKRFADVLAIKGVHVQVFDNTGVLKMIAERKPEADKLHIADERRFAAFLRKGDG